MDNPFIKNKMLLLELPEKIDGDRIYLRPFQKGDGKEFYQILQENADHLRNAMLEVDTIGSVDEAEIRNRHLYGDWISRKRYVFAICDKTTNQIVGENWIEPTNMDLGIYELGYFIIKSQEGRGLVTESCKLSLKFIFNHLKGTKVEIQTDELNTRSCSVAERLGFKKEGALRNRTIVKGKAVARIYYGMLADEFERDMSFTE